MLPSLAGDAKRLCQSLLRIDTTNPPGNERAAAELIAGALREVGFEPQLLEAEPHRTNLVVRHRGTGAKPPLLLTAHLDVVEADPTKWQRTPFSGEEYGGSAWESNPPNRCSRRATSVLKLIADDHPQVYLGVRSCPFSSRKLRDPR